MRRLFDRSAERKNPGDVHALGTGRILVYGQGPEWMQVIGAPYSCPSLFTLRLDDDASAPILSVTERTPGTSEYVHRISVRQAKRPPRDIGIIRDIACKAQHTILRTWSLDESVTFRLCSDRPLSEITAILGEDTPCRAAFSVSVPQNAPVFNDYPVGTPSTQTIALRGDAEIRRIDTGLELVLSGQGEMLVCCGEMFPAAHASLCLALRADTRQMIAAQKRYDRRYLDTCAANRTPLPSGKIGDETENAVEDVLLQIHAQQSEQGGIMAGHAYHMAYIRDQYGVLRGLLAMGDHAGARAILSFYLDIAKRIGFPANAQGMGENSRITHVHENDSTELPSYLVLSCLEYLKATGDRAFFERCLPLCCEALRRSLSVLVGGMMPFNGDETYIAGGLLPRTVIEQGSLEATALFLASAAGFKKVCLDLQLPLSALPAGLDEAIAEAAEQFPANFARRGGYTVNAPRRSDLCAEPMYRHGVCYFGDSFGWLYHVTDGIYVCPACAHKVEALRASEEASETEDTEYRLHTVYLTLPFIGTDEDAPASLLGIPELSNSIRKLLCAYRKNGKMPSAAEQSRIVGYDFGMMLYAAAVTGEDADDLLTAALAARGESGMWSEYYEGSPARRHPVGTRCRPWESAVNLCGILRYLQARD